jgi:hypothetical protein
MLGRWNEELGDQKLSIAIFGIMNITRKYPLSDFYLEQRNR